MVDEDMDFVWPSLPISNDSPSYRPVYGPYFDPIYPTNISVLAGQTIVLQCRIVDLVDRVVIITFISLALLNNILLINHY